MDNEIIRKVYELWCRNATADIDIITELKEMESDFDRIEDAFYRNLTLGTGGLRGTIGAGTNRMNVYTVARASQGVANYLQREFGDKASVVIGYDSRIKSALFARVAAAVFANNGIQVHIWPTLNPVPTVSFAVRYLNASQGIMITASHNPSQYNGYKVYGNDGCQITTGAAAEIMSEIEKVDAFDVNFDGFDEKIAVDSIKYIDDSVQTAFIDEVKSQSVITEDIDRNVAIVYSPLNGTGLLPVTRVLKESGFTNITLVTEQGKPDGNFPTCPYPNPEIREAMELGLEYCSKVGADLLIATDPDADRCGIAVKNGSGDYQLLSGNETGLLLFDFICAQRIKNGTMPESPVMIKTIVTSDMGKQIADHYGVNTIDVLTGFKFIGEQIGELEKVGRENDYIFGFEESYGYLTGSYVRDKDAVDAAFMISEMFAYYKTHGISLLDKLDELYQTYGYRLNTLHSYTFEGSAGFEKMQGIMKWFRETIKAGESKLGGVEIREILDYLLGRDGLPKSDVLKYLLDANGTVVVRPSGTEPKLKVYISIAANSMDSAEAIETKIAAEMDEYMK